MNEVFISVFKYIIEFIHHAIAEVSIILFLFGLIFFLIGIAILVAIVFVILRGERVNGKVIGGIEEIRFKEKEANGKVVKKTRKSLRAVYEYTGAGGSVHHNKSSNAGDFVLNYKTGQPVKLIVCRYKEKNDDIYDIEERSPIIIGGVFLFIGIFIIFMASSIYTSLGIGAVALLGIIVSLVFKVKNKPRPSSSYKGVSHSKLDLNKVRPIEVFLKDEGNV